MFGHAVIDRSMGAGDNPEKLLLFERTDGLRGSLGVMGAEP